MDIYLCIKLTLQVKKESKKLISKKKWIYIFREMYKPSGKNSAGYGFELEVQPYSASWKKIQKNFFKNEIT